MPPFSGNWPGIPAWSKHKGDEQPVKENANNVDQVRKVGLKVDKNETALRVDLEIKLE